MPKKFNYKEFYEKVHQNHIAYKINLEKAEGQKEMTLVHTNYFQDCLKDSMESILKSKEARRIPIKIIISILKERGTLSTTRASDSMKICDIRDWFTHRINIKSVEEDTRELIKSMGADLDKKINVMQTKEITDVRIYKDEEKENSESYEKLTIICSDLTEIVTNDTLEHKDRS